MSHQSPALVEFQQDTDFLLYPRSEPWPLAKLIKWQTERGGIDKNLNPNVKVICGRKLSLTGM